MNVNGFFSEGDVYQSIVAPFTFYDCMCHGSFREIFVNTCRYIHCIHMNCKRKNIYISLANHVPCPIADPHIKRLKPFLYHKALLNQIKFLGSLILANYYTLYRHYQKRMQHYPLHFIVQFFVSICKWFIVCHFIKYCPFILNICCLTEMTCGLISYV